MQAQESHHESYGQVREAFEDIGNRARHRKHTIFINGKEKVAFLEKVAQTKLAQVREPELIFLFKSESREHETLRT